jgi:glycosyltransferase involved in cell wall biosynthesis
MTERPLLTVVIPSVGACHEIFSCLDALRAAARPVPLEIIVVDRCGEAFRHEIAGRFPECHIVAAPTDTSIPALRQIGFARASGQAVAVIEDHVIVPPAWAQHMMAALDSGADAVGGPVYNGATSSIVDRAAFLCEYAPLLPPLSAGPTDTLPGNNVGYRRTVLDRHRHAADGHWEDVLHAAMRAHGSRLEMRPEISVEHRQHVRFADYILQRFLYSRSYAGLRATNAARVRRLIMAGASLALPPVLLGRIARHAARAGASGEFTRTFPLLVVFVSAWAAGEAAGWLAGAGNALARVR